MGAMNHQHLMEAMKEHAPMRMWCLVSVFETLKKREGTLKVSEITGIISFKDESLFSIYPKHLALVPYAQIQN